MMPSLNITEEFDILRDCQLCPRKCRVNRLEGQSGYCRAGAGYEIASVSIHKGEEPVISGKNGICNVFFSHCTMQCVYCQNYQISRKDCPIKVPGQSLDEITKSIKGILNEGVESLGFVSPSHMVPQMKTIINKLRSDGYNPYIVYNTNGYDSLETLKSLDDYVDIYLPDFKYADANLARKWSDAPDYFEVAAKTIKEMIRQKGNVVRLNDRGIAEKGVIVRHLVLPESVENSISVLTFLAEEVSVRLTLSLMAQYHPIAKVAAVPPLNNKLNHSDYTIVVRKLEELGFTKGWIQDLDSADFYIPDFRTDKPFG